MRRASAARRTVLGSIHLCLAIAAVAVLLLLGLLDPAPFRPPPHWFWTEWILARWLDAPWTIINPLVAVGIVSSATLELATAFDRDPFARLLRIRTVTTEGRQPELWRHLLRFLGHVLSSASLGLGFAWCLVSRHGRTWSDLMSGTVCIADDAE